MHFFYIHKLSDSNLVSALRWLNKGVRGELREGEGIVVPCLPHQIRGACAGVCGLAIRNCSCNGLPRLELYRCVAHRQCLDSTTYWVTSVAPGTDISRLVTVRGLQEYWWEHEREVAHQKVLRARDEVHEVLAERKYISEQLEEAKEKGYTYTITECEERLANLNYEVRDCKEDFKHALLDRSHKCCSECELAFAAQVRYPMLRQVGRRENSYFWETIHDLVNRTLSGDIPLPLPVVNSKEIPCIVSNRTSDIFGTEVEEWSENEEEESEEDSDYTAWEDREE